MDYLFAILALATLVAAFIWLVKRALKEIRAKQKTATPPNHTKNNIVKNVNTPLKPTTVDQEKPEASEDYSSVSYESINLLIRGKKGTYDESFFVDPETRKFRFPKYKHDNNFLIKITDLTDYREIREMISPEEKRDLNMSTIEHYLEDSIELEVAPFPSLFNKPKTDHLGPYNYLKGQGDKLADLLAEIESQDKEYFIADNKLRKTLLKNGCLKLHELADEAQKHEYFSTFTASDLKGICPKAGLKISLKKDQLIDQIIAKAIPVDLPPAVTITDDFHSMMEIFYDIYINDVRANLDRFHPLYIPAAWNWVLTDADCTAVEKKAQEILESKYWEARLKEVGR